MKPNHAQPFIGPIVYALVEMLVETIFKLKDIPTFKRRTLNPPFKVGPIG